MPSYPIAYRKQALPYQRPVWPRPGFQWPDQPSPLPKPANDPRISPFKRAPAKTFGRRGLEKATERGLIRTAGKLGSRLIPILGEALIVWDIYEIITDGPIPPGPLPEPEITDPPGWTPLNEAVSGNYWWRAPFPGDFVGGHEGLHAGVYGNGFRSPSDFGEPASTDAQIAASGQVALEVGYQFDGAPAPQPAVIRSWTKGIGVAGKPDWLNRPGREIEYRRVPREVYEPGILEVPFPIPGQTYETGPKPTRKKREEEWEDTRKRTEYEPPFVINVPGTGPTPRPAPHANVPPPTGDKETKTIATPRASSLFGRIIGGVTESVDFIKAVWEGLPPQYQYGKVQVKHGPKKGKWVQKGFPTPTQMMRDLYNNWDHLDVKKAIENVAKEQIQDTLIGGINRRTQRAAKPWYDRSGRMVGFSTGPAM